MANGSLKGKVAIVTGSSKGIGRAIALRLARDGASVVVNGRNEADIAAVVNEIKKAKGKAIGVRSDVSIAKDVERLAAETVKQFKRIDILVNNAGVLDMKACAEMTEQEWDRILDINLKGYFLCARASAAQMVKQKSGGKIVNIASIAGMRAYPGCAAYNASKAGIISLTQTLALELAKEKINVNAIAPGAIETAMTKNVLEDKHVYQQMLANIPWGRIGKPEDIANAVAFLVSSDADYITGAVLVVDGGWTAHL
ncbi:MAG: 3-oxoacyl-ACP reductase family protein [Candidatus Aenigmatarchaeota archaeon]